MNYLTLLWGLSLQLGHEERCVRLVQLSPCATLSPTESKSERLSANKTSQNWSSVRARPCRVREGGKKRVSTFQKPLSSVYRRVTSFQKVLREAARQGRGWREPRSVMKGWRGSGSLWDSAIHVSSRNHNLLSWTLSTNLSCKLPLSHHAAASKTSPLEGMSLFFTLCLNMFLTHPLTLIPDEPSWLCCSLEGICQRFLMNMTRETVQIIWNIVWQFQDAISDSVSMGESMADGIK